MGPARATSRNASMCSTKKSDGEAGWQAGGVWVGSLPEAFPARPVAAGSLLPSERFPSLRPPLRLILSPTPVQLGPPATCAANRAGKSLMMPSTPNSSSSVISAESLIVQTCT